MLNDDDHGTGDSEFVMTWLACEVFMLGNSCHCWMRASYTWELAFAQLFTKAPAGFCFKKFEGQTASSLWICLNDRDCASVLPFVFVAWERLAIQQSCYESSRPTDSRHNDYTGSNLQQSNLTIKNLLGTSIAPFHRYFWRWCSFPNGGMFYFPRGNPFPAKFANFEVSTPGESQLSGGWKDASVKGGHPENDGVWLVLCGA